MSIRDLLMRTICQFNNSIAVMVIDNKFPQLFIEHLGFDGKYINLLTFNYLSLPGSNTNDFYTN